MEARRELNIAGGVDPRWCQMVNTAPGVGRHRLQFLHFNPAMVYQASSPFRLAAGFVLLSLLSILVPANALYFYVDGRQTKCFFEDLPKDTLVAGKGFEQLL